MVNNNQFAMNNNPTPAVVSPPSTPDPYDSDSSTNNEPIKPPPLKRTCTRYNCTCDTRSERYCRIYGDFR